jgi:hypothetical protein
MSIESPFLFVRVGSLTMCVIRNKPLCQLGTLITIWAKLHRSSKCVETLVALCGLGGCALKVDRLLIDPIVNLKRIAPIYMNICT